MIFGHIKRTGLIFKLFLITASLAAGQVHTIRGNIENAGKGYVYLASYYGDRFDVVDSIHTASGAFYFLLDEADPIGVYRIIFRQVEDVIMTENRFIEFIYHGEDLEILIASGKEGPVPYFGNSLENRVYSDFISFEIAYEERIINLDEQLYAEYDSLQILRNAYIDSMTRVHPDLYATRIINAFRSPSLPPSMTHRERIDTLKIAYFNQAAIDDPMLLHAPVYTYRLIEYLSLFQEDTLSLIQQQAQFIEAVDRIMVNVSQDRELRSFIVEYLLDGFELLGMNRVVEHLGDHYLDERCEADIMEMVRERMEEYELLAEGERAPDFVIRDLAGRNHQLSLLDHPYILVMFWASTCEHCQELVPELHEWYLGENSIDLEVVAISIDTTAAQLEDFISRFDPAWISVHESLGWLGKIPSDYSIYATPALFLLDRDLTILDKPGSYRQFIRAVKRLEP